jgi:small-conductance mechanosensitive channel
MDFLSSILESILIFLKSPQHYWQWITIAICGLMAVLISQFLDKTLFHPGSTFCRFCVRFFNPDKRIGGVPVIFTALLWITWKARKQWSEQLVNAGHDAVQSNHIHSLALLCSAYVVYLLANAISQNKLVPRLLSGGMLIIFTFHIFGWLMPLSKALQSIDLPLGDIHINLWSIISGATALFVLLWIVNLANRFIETAIQSQNDIPPAIKVLISKTSRIFLFSFAIIAALSIGGVPLKGLTVFSGALGLGLGFGLQKIIANLISGLIILLDKSIKPGDVIEIEGTFGWINSIQTRYVSVLTRDRKEYLIPNEDFVTHKVINWSHSDRTIRIKADVGVSYDTDIPVAIKLCKEAISTIPRILNEPAPVCLLKEFGDSSVNLQIRFWINDAPNGVSNIRSEVLLAIWQTFRDNDIQIPFPQRDLHIKSGTLISNH